MSRNTWTELIVAALIIFVLCVACPPIIFAVQDTGVKSLHPCRVEFDHPTPAPFCAALDELSLARWNPETHGD